MSDHWAEPPSPRLHNGRIGQTGSRATVKLQSDDINNNDNNNAFFLKAPFKALAHPTFLQKPAVFDWVPLICCRAAAVNPTINQSGAAGGGH